MRLLENMSVLRSKFGVLHKFNGVARQKNSVAQHKNSVLRFSSIFVALICCQISTAHASNVCLDALRSAEEKMGIPEGLLAAIGRTEAWRPSRRQIWPWTVVIDGTPHYLEDQESAVKMVLKSLGDGRTNIDVGCTQVNLRWHGRSRSAETLLDPTSNALYAASHLVDLYARFGSWKTAVARYHSADSNRGMRYACRVARSYAQMADEDLPGCQP